MHVPQTDDTVLLHGALDAGVSPFQRDSKTGAALVAVEEVLLATLPTDAALIAVEHSFAEPIIVEEVTSRAEVLGEWD